LGFGLFCSDDMQRAVPDPDKISSFMNIRTEPIPKYGEIRCYIRDPDGYIIEVGQSTDLKYG
jgi:hypothetical protein